MRKSHTDIPVTYFPPNANSTKIAEKNLTPWWNAVFFLGCNFWWSGSPLMTAADAKLCKANSVGKKSGLEKWEAICDPKNI